MSMFNLGKRMWMGDELSNINVLGTVPAYIQRSLPGFQGCDFKSAYPSVWVTLKCSL